eukprot:1924498-Rhodomonas_salina.1
MVANSARLPPAAMPCKSAALGIAIGNLTLCGCIVDGKERDEEKPLEQAGVHASALRLCWNHTGLSSHSARKSVPASLSGCVDDLREEEGRVTTRGCPLVPCIIIVMHDLNTRHRTSRTGPPYRVVLNAEQCHVSPCSTSVSVTA